MMPKPLLATPSFITVDLDVLGAPGQSIDALAAAFHRAGIVQCVPQNDEQELLVFALGAQYKTMGENIAALLSLIESFDEELVREWDSASARVFNVGIEVVDAIHQPIVSVSADVVAHAAKHKVGFTFTHYLHGDRNERITHTNIL